MRAIAHRLVAAAALAGTLGGLPAAARAAAPGPVVSTAPGRIVFAVDDGSVLKRVDGSGAGAAIALPDGKALMFGSGAGAGIHVARIDARGALDPSFGSGGVTTIPVPPAAAAGILAFVRQPDGKLLIVSHAPSPAPVSTPDVLQVTRLNADLTLDRAYGSAGTATTGIGVGCGCSSGGLAPDGSLVLAGATGNYGTPPGPSHLHMAVTRLTPAGAVDERFGAGGIATIPTAIPASGFNVAFGPGGTIVVQGQSQAGLLDFRSDVVLTRLTRDGALDPAFAGGTPIEVPFDTGSLMLVGADGSVVINGATGGGKQPPDLSPSRQLLARFTAAGVIDPTFGAGGLADIGSAVTPSQLLPAAAGGVLVVGTPTYTLAPGSQQAPGRIIVRRLAADGTFDPAFGGAGGHTVDLPFGGGGSSFLVSVHPRPVPSIVQNSFQGTRLVPRPDGSYLVAGGVLVSQPTGEGEGFSIGRFAAAALTPSIALDSSFGGPATAPALSVRVARQRASTARRVHAIRIVLKSSAVGLARVKILHGGRAIAYSLLPVFGTTSRTLPVELTAYGNRYLRRHHRHVRVTVRATGRDLLTSTATATATGRLK